MYELRRGIVRGAGEVEDGTYTFITFDGNWGDHIIVRQGQGLTWGRWLLDDTHDPLGVARAAGFTHGWWLPKRFISIIDDPVTSVTVTVPFTAADLPLRHGLGTLRLESIDTDWSVYLTADEDAVYLQHGTGRVLVAFDDLDIDEQFKKWKAENPLVNFKDWLMERTHEPDDVDDQVDMCTQCGDPSRPDDMYWANDQERHICEGCRDFHFYCHHCEELFSSTTTVYGDREVCQGCLDNSYAYCDHCEEYYHGDSGCDGDHSDYEQGNDCCESPQQEFMVRNDGLDPVKQDERVTVSMPGGVISAEGIAQIQSLIQAQYYAMRTEALGDDGRWKEGTNIEEIGKWWTLSHSIEPLGDEWQTRRGNFTKRLSRLAHTDYGLKLPPKMVSEVGNIGAAHSKGVDFGIEFTRDLNQSAADFAHEESCWWQSYHEGRCALKTNGGFGMRTFKDNESNGYKYQSVEGRAWIMPLRWTDADSEVPEPGSCTDPSYCTPVMVKGSGFVPTFDTLDADAYVVFNGYGDLSGYAPARILAHMTGMTYRKVSFRCAPMYVNGDAGYLVAPEEIAERYTDGDVSLSVAQHSDLFNTEQVITEKELAHA